MNNPVGLAFGESGESFLSGTFLICRVPVNEMVFYMPFTGVPMEEK